jgi:hypothetical protein
MYHKDGTDHGPTMSTVRDHRPRHVIVMFYPIETSESDHHLRPNAQLQAPPASYTTSAPAGAYIARR